MERNGKEVILKFDFKKDYDCVNLRISATYAQKVGFWKKVMCMDEGMHCYCSSLFWLKVCHIKLYIQQGDNLSPFLFHVVA